MHAVIKTGGKQYRVAPADLIAVERLDGEAGTMIDLKTVLMVVDGAEVAVGTPTVAGASVAAEIVEQTRGDKVIIFKKRRRQNSRRKNGHRQDLTLLRITEISGFGRTAKAEAVAASGEEGAAKPKRARKKAAAEATESTE